MKKIGLIALFASLMSLIVLPGFASAKAPANLCMNYGHQDDHYELTQVLTDLTQLQATGISCVRLSYMGWNNPESESLALLAKLMGFRVIIGGDWPVITPDQLSNYHKQVLLEAKWTEANHIDQLSLGNEQEYRLSGIDKDDWYQFLETLATDVRLVYAGDISYETSGDFAEYWATKTLGDIDLLGLNLYCGIECSGSFLAENIKAHGVEHVYVSEVNADMKDSGKYDIDTNHAERVSEVVLGLLKQRVPVYYFTYHTCNGKDGVDALWGLIQCGKSTQPETATVLGFGS